MTGLCVCVCVCGVAVCVCGVTYSCGSNVSGNLVRMPAVEKEEKEKEEKKGKGRIIHSVLFLSFSGGGGN